MQVAFHFGSHGTEPERMIKTLMENRDWLLANGVEVVAPGRLKGVLDEAVSSLAGGQATAQMEEVIYDALLDGDDVRRLIISQASLLGTPARSLSPSGYFAQAAGRIRALANLFPSAEVEVSLAIQNPALQIPHLVSRLPDPSFDRAMAGLDPLAMRWAPSVRAIREALQGRRLIVWCYEDTPLIWPEAVRRVATMPTDVPLKAGLAVLGDILTPEGLAELRERLTQGGRLTVAARRELFADVLGRHARPEAVHAEVNGAAWSQDIVDAITEAYEDDVAEIAALPGVEFLSP
ncbi:hypothetical protein [Paracoccus luteus]|uniref:hypothetical protein n=1 Tax=Paracoccus luteus TaxID=2508543 RepID=UPI0010702A15|nr:hypothetical protein [Paracoccus luteus]